MEMNELLLTINPIGAAFSVAAILCLSAFIGYFVYRFGKDTDMARIKELERLNQKLLDMYHQAESDKRDYLIRISSLQAELDAYGLDESDSKQDEESDLSWVRFIATDEDGEIMVYSEEPIKVMYGWYPTAGYCKSITKEEAMYLCGKIPVWDNEKPTPVKQ